MDPHDPDSLEFMLVRVCRAFHKVVGYELAQIGLHRGQPHVLFALAHHDGMTNSELAEHLDADPNGCGEVEAVAPPLGQLRPDRFGVAAPKLRAGVMLDSSVAAPKFRAGLMFDR